MHGIYPRYGRPLLVGPARLWAAGVVASCLVLVSVLGIVFANQTTADWLDHAIDAPIVNGFKSHQGLAGAFAAPGSLLPPVALTATVVLACLLAGRINGAILAAAAVPAAVGLNDGLLKHLVHRTYLGVLSYPSGHTATMFALAATVTVLLIPAGPVKTGPVRLLIAAAACLLGGVVAVGVIGLRWHYFTDTVAGAAVGIGTVCALTLVLDLPAWRCQPSGTSVPAGR